MLTEPSTVSKKMEGRRKALQARHQRIHCRWLVVKRLPFRFGVNKARGGHQTNEKRESPDGEVSSRRVHIDNVGSDDVTWSNELRRTILHPDRQPGIINKVHCPNFPPILGKRFSSNMAKS